MVLPISLLLGALTTRLANFGCGAINDEAVVTTEIASTTTRREAIGARLCIIDGSVLGHFSVKLKAKYLSC